MNVIDLKVSGAGASGAMAILHLVQRLDIFDRERTAGRFLACSADMLVNLVESAHLLFVFGAPCGNGRLRFYVEQTAISLCVVACLLTVSPSVVLAHLIWVALIPPFLLGAILLWIIGGPSARLRVVRSRKSRVAGAPAGEVLGIEGATAFNTTADAGKTLGHVAALAWLAGEVSLQTLLQRFFARNNFHFNTPSLAQGAVT
jgi:hypothetical protein